MEKGTIEAKTIKVQGKDRTIYVASSEKTMDTGRASTTEKTKDMERTASVGRDR